MKVRVKNHLLAKKNINRVSYNAVYNILACIVDACDTLCFYLYQPDNAFLQLFSGISKPSGKKTCLAWSPDGQLLALGSASLELWRFDGKKIFPLKTMSQDFIDIKMIVWSPDSISLAYGGLSKKNTIKIRHLQTGAVQQIAIPLAIAAISYDPFGKYLLLQVCNNIVYVYNSNSLLKIKEVALSPKASSHDVINTVKETRIMGWSPDFNELVCPSLDDSKIALAVNLSRSANFSTKKVFIGHVSSISCARFNPNLYQWNGEIVSILALGDSHGVVSLWRVGTIRNYDRPLLISNSNAEVHQVVEEFEWDQTGQILFVNMMKRYINVLHFQKSSFGREINQQQKVNIIETSYGVKSASQIHKKQLEVFSFQSLNNYNKNKQSKEEKDNQLSKNSRKIGLLTVQSQKTQEHPFQVVGNKQAPPQIETSFQNISQNDKNKIGQKVEYVKINDQVTTKDKNNKKKIQPAMLVRKDQVEKMNNIYLGNQQNSLNFNLSSMFQSLKLKPLQLDCKIFKTSRSSYLQVKKVQGCAIVQLIQNKDLQKNSLNQRVFTGLVDYISSQPKNIYLLNQGNLYIFDLNLNLSQLPYCIGDVHRLTINAEGDIYYINTKGIIRGFNHQTSQCYIPSLLPIQTLFENIKLNNKLQREEEKEDSKIIDEFSVERDHNLYVSFIGNRNRYFFDRAICCWVSLEFNEGIIKNGHSIRVSDSQQKLMNDFFKSITSKLFQQQALIKQKYPSTSLHLFSQNYESNMIYYKKHNPNRELYKQNLLNMIREMKSKNQSGKLRSAIVKYFIDHKSEFYEDDIKLRQKVKQIGGSVIQQFILFEQL